MTAQLAAGLVRRFLVNGLCKPKTGGIQFV